MFKRFFAALSALTTNAEALAASMAEANVNFRANLGLDAPEMALPAPQNDAEAENDSRPTRNSRRSPVGR
jgi:hypothetical protein